MKKSIIMIVVLFSIVVVYWVLRAEEIPAQSVQVDDPALRKTTTGEVLGFVRDHGAGVWLGIPFAKPPVGELRWRAPQPPESWDGVREALEISDVCPQMANRLTGDGPDSQRKIAGVEDCLYLNVYAPANAKNLPVMLWLHGGGNSLGSGGSYNGDKLATDGEVVVVTINYRLAHLGWFAHPALQMGLPNEDSGNFGTLDMIRALEWTRDNIAAFGGNSDNVTVFGQSSGGGDTLTMVASPLAAGLFHRAIVQSGGLRITSMSQAQNYASDGGHRMSSREIVNHMLVNDGTVANLDEAKAQQEEMQPDDLRNYLRSKSLDEVYSMFEKTGFGTIGVPMVFGDGHVLPADSVENILTDPDKHNSVPIMLGSNRDEPSRFMMLNPQNVETTAEGVRSFKDEGRYLRAVKYGAMAWKERGVDTLADYLTTSGNSKVFTYRFDWDEEGTEKGLDLSKAIGAGHSLEIAFVFGNFIDGVGLTYLYEDSDQKDALANSMMSYWAEFAYNGNPGRGRDSTEVEWLSWGTDGKSSIVLDTPSDQGIFMMSDVVSVAYIKKTIAEDPGITEQRERCMHYVRTFRWGGNFDQAEYDNFGPEGCAAFDPKEFAGF